MPRKRMSSLEEPKAPRHKRVLYYSLEREEGEPDEVGQKPYLQIGVFDSLKSLLAEAPTFLQDGECCRVVAVLRELTAREQPPKQLRIKLEPRQK